MIYFFQSLSLKMRFLGVLLWLFPVLLLGWLVHGAPWALASLQGMTGGHGLPSHKFWVPPDVLAALFDAWGAPGQALYLTVLLPSAVGFALAYGAFLTAATLYLLKKSNPRGPWWYLLPALPVAASGFDLVTHGALAAALLLPERAWDLAPWVVAGAHAAQVVALGTSLVVLIVGTFVSLARNSWTRIRW